ncbi:MAG: dihydrofolate reductase [Aestuariivirga sp.]
MSQVTEIALVYAVSRNGVIGKDGGLPWHVPSDLKHFKAVTLGKPVVMGRKTWESLPKKPLPGRQNIVVTRKPDYSADGADVVNSIEDAIISAGAVSEVCVIGGAELFKEILPRADRIYLTRILADVSGDTFLPELSRNEWKQVERAPHAKGEKDSAAFETFTYERR